MPRFALMSPMSRAIACFTLCAGMVPGAAAQKSGPVSSSTPAQEAIKLVEQGKCAEALPLLRKALPGIKQKQIRYQAGMAATRCAMSLNQTETAVQALLMLRREFPHDPQVLFITTHYYSELANRAAQELAAVSPLSPQAQQLEAEALESQGKWDDAAAEYRKILARNPNLPGIHYRLGRLFLSKPETPDSGEEAKKELQAELKIDPTNASAEFMLGEIARRAGAWEEAAQHFSRAARLDPGFSEAFLALGMSLSSAGKHTEAVAPLETYVKMQPADPAGHYQLGIAYSRTGEKAKAEHEMTVQREITEKTQSGAAPPIPH